MGMAEPARDVSLSVGCLCQRTRFHSLSVLQILRAPSSPWCRDGCLLALRPDQPQGKKKAHPSFEGLQAKPHAPTVNPSALGPGAGLGGCQRAPGVSKLSKGDLIGSSFPYSLIFQGNNSLGLMESPEDKSPLREKMTLKKHTSPARRTRTLRRLGNISVVPGTLLSTLDA